MAKKMILIVNEDPDIVKTLSPILRARNYAVSEASGGTAGLEKARTDRPDLILLEDKMSDMDGFDVCAKLKAERATKNIPVIMISGNGGHDSVLKAHSSGPERYDLELELGFRCLAEIEGVWYGVSKAWKIARPPVVREPMVGVVGRIAIHGDREREVDLIVRLIGVVPGMEPVTVFPVYIAWAGAGVY